jgi:RNA polymerase sigma factor (sigma-70 family)
MRVLDANAAEEDDSVLAARAATDVAAFAALYDRYFARVYGYVCYRVGDTGTADDIVSELFERVLTKIASYRPEKGPFAGWLFASARNAVNSHLRVERRRGWFSLELLVDRQHHNSAPEEIVIEGEKHADLLASLRRLDERQRDLIGLKFSAGLTNGHIAHLTGLSESNVAVILHRAARCLRAELAARGWKNE